MKIWHGCLLLALAIPGLVGVAHGAVVNWTNGQGGSWQEPTNWSSSPLLPSSTDNVVLGPAEPNYIHVDHTQGTDTVKTLTNYQFLTVKDSQLTVTGNVTLARQSRLDVSGQGAVFQGLGSVFFTGGVEVSAQQGGLVSLPGAKHYAADPWNPTFWANGAGSRIDLPALEDVTGWGIVLVARDGAVINAPKLSSTQPPDGLNKGAFTAEGVGSKIDVSSLRDFGGGLIQALDGGEVVLSSEQIQNAQVIVQGAESKLNLSHLTSLDTFDLRAEVGAQLAFPLVNRIDRGTFRTGGGNSRIDLSAVQAIGAPPFQGWITPGFYAEAHSTIDLSGLQRLDGAQPWLEAKGAGAVIDLSNLESFVGASSGQLRVSGGGQILTPKLTRLENVSVVADGFGSQLQLERLTTIDFIQVNALSGALLAFPAVTGLNVAPGSRGNYINADGGVVDLSAVTAFRGAAAGFSLVQALHSGRIDLSSVPNLIAGNVEFRSEGPGSVIDLNRMATLLNSNDVTRLLAKDGGRIQLQALTAARGIELSSAGTGSAIGAPSLTILNHAQLEARDGASLTLPALLRAEGTLRGESVGAGSVLALPAWTTGTANDTVYLLAQGGGQLDVPAVEALAASTIEIRVEDPGSLANLPRLQSLAVDQPAGIQLQIHGGGRLHAPELTSLANATIDLAQPGSQLDTGPLAALDQVTVAVQDRLQTELNTAAKLTAKGLDLRVQQPQTVLTLPTLAELIGQGEAPAVLAAREGGKLIAPAVTSLTRADVSASDAGSEIAFGPLSMLDNTRLAVFGGRLEVDASNLDARTTELLVSGGTLALPNLESYRDATGSSALTVEQGVADFGQRTVAFEGVRVQKFQDAELRAGEVQLGAGASLEGIGLLAADITNAGSLKTPFGGALTVAGDYTQLAAGTLHVAFRPFETPALYEVRGHAHLGGRLELTNEGGVLPPLGEAQVVLRATQIEGDFASGGLLLSNGWMLAPIVRDNAALVVAAIAGDANLDGHVDLSDFGTLKQHLGGQGRVEQGDFDGDGAVTLSDFGALKSNFGRQGPGFQPPAAVAPEASSATLLALGAMLLAVSRRRARRPR